MGYNPTMLSPYRFLVGLILALSTGPVVAQVPTPEPATTPTPAPAAEPQAPAERQLDFATVQVRLMERIAARIDQDVKMLNQEFKLEGTYYKDTGHRVRLQLNLIGLGDTGSTMLQVCDGKVLWDFQKVLGMQSYRRREITPILKKLEDPNLDDSFRVMITSNMGFGGPEALLSGLRKAVNFNQMSEEKLDGEDVFVIAGIWRDRSSLLDPTGRPLPPTADLPPYIPNVIRVFIKKATGWPAKVEMIGNAPLLMQEDIRQFDPATGRPVGRPVKPPKVDPTRITLRYTLTSPDEIKPGLFDFTAPADVAGTNVKDETKEFLDVLDRYIQVAKANKQAEAARAEGEPLLKAPPIEVGKDPAGGLGTPSPPGGASPPR